MAAAAAAFDNHVPPVSVSVEPTSDRREHATRA